MMGMVQNGCFAMTVALGIIGVVLYQCLLVTLNLNCPINVPQKAVESSNIKQDFASETYPKLDLHVHLKRDKNYDPVFFPQNGSKNQVFEQGAKEGQENSWPKPLQEEEPTLSCRKVGRSLRVMSEKCKSCSWRT